eukprot:1159049-Pelagomonas_calceolata.AAC.2
MTGLFFFLHFPTCWTGSLGRPPLGDPSEKKLRLPECNHTPGPLGSNWAASAWEPGLRPGHKEATKQFMLQSRLGR